MYKIVISNVNSSLLSFAYKGTQYQRLYIYLIVGILSVAYVKKRNNKSKAAREMMSHGRLHIHLSIN